MESCTLPNLPLRRRMAAWTAQYGERFDRDDVFAADLEHFDATIETGELGALRFARLTCGGGALDRTHAAPTSLASGSYTLIVQIAGSGTLRQYGRQARLQPGEIALCDNAAPHAHSMESGSELLLLRIPARQLRAHLPAPEQFCGHRLQAAQGVAASAASLIGGLCRQTWPAVPGALQETLARQALELLAIGFTLEYGQLAAPSPVVGGRHAQARQFIERNLRDPELGPRAIANALRVSSRYLRMIFANASEPVSSYILRRRLEETARQLADPRWRGRSICEIAFDWGFNSAPHFSRTFRDRYGMSPREYRVRHADPVRDTPAALAPGV